MSLIHFEGIILKTIPYKETSKIVTVFTRNRGKISFIGTSSQKSHSHNAAVLQIGNLVKGVYYKKQEFSTLGTLNQISIVSQFPKSKSDFMKLALSQYAIEFTGKNIEEEEVNIPLYDLLFQSLNDIENLPVKKSWLQMWDYHALKVMGFEPVFEHCVVCGSSLKEGVWNPSEGGVACKHHELRGIMLHQEDIRTLKDLSKQFDSKKECHLSPSVKEAFRRMLNEYCGGPFKVLTFYGIS